jgi:hypothetical protein
MIELGHNLDLLLDEEHLVLLPTQLLLVYHLRKGNLSPPMLWNHNYFYGSGSAF